jgi:glutaredoxin
MDATDIEPLAVTFYTKAGCPLCDEARDLLDEIASTTPYELTEIDIRRDLALFEQYRYRIPVIIVNNERSVEGRIEYADLYDLLTEKRSPHEQQKSV